MSAIQREVLFYVFMVFFILIGVGSLAVLLGWRKGADPAFRKWALGGFVGAVTLAMIGLFKIGFSQPVEQVAQPTILVTLLPAEGMGRIERGTYETQEVTPGPPQMVVSGPRGEVLAALEQGGFQVQLPGDLSSKSVQLHFKDVDGRPWQTKWFWPNRSQQPMEVSQRVEGQPAAVDPTAWLPIEVVLVAGAEPAAAAGLQKQASLKFDNYARASKPVFNQRFWEWRVFVDEPLAVLNTIQQVDYLLHPTFPDPFRTTRDRDRMFELISSGWGEFTIVITVHYTNSTEEKASYRLNLSKGWPATAAAIRPRLDRIRVVEDGSPGVTGWLFEILVDGKTALSLPKRNYDKEGTASNVVPDAARRWLNVRLRPGQKARIDVKGRRAVGGDTATGTGTLSANGTASVTVQHAKDPTKGAFVFSFSTGT